MGYFSKRKKQKREILFLSTVLLLLGLATIAAFFDDGGSSIIYYIDAWRFQLYIILLLIMLYAVISRHLLFAAAALLLLGGNYMILASSGPLFFNQTSEPGDQLRLFYQNSPKDMDRFLHSAGSYNARIAGINFRHDTYIPKVADNTRYHFFHTHGDIMKTALFAEDMPLRSGKINFSHNQEASFMVFEQSGHRFVLLNLYFSRLPISEQETVFRNLAEFVLSQDDPVIVVGDFGVPAWIPVFKNFLKKTALEVKNHIILSDGRYRINPFAVPTFYILGYRNVGVSDITFLPRKNAKTFPVGITLNIRPAETN